MYVPQPGCIHVQSVFKRTFKQESPGENRGFLYYWALSTVKVRWTFERVGV
jgi:hypothetical protein